MAHNGGKGARLRHRARARGLTPEGRARSAPYWKDALRICDTKQCPRCHGAVRLEWYAGRGAYYGMMRAVNRYYLVCGMHGRVGALEYLLPPSLFDHTPAAQAQGA